MAQRAHKKKRCKAIQAKIANIRTDWTHKATTAIARRAKLMVIGDVSSAKLTKTAFTALVENFPDRHARGANDQIIRINELLPQSLGQLAPNARLSAAAISEKNDTHADGIIGQGSRQSPVGGRQQCTEDRRLATGDCRLFPA